MVLSDPSTDGIGTCIGLVGYLGLGPACLSLTGLLIGVLGPTILGGPIHLGDVPGDPILLDPMAGEPIILGNPTILGPIPSINLGLTSPGIIVFCLKSNGALALEVALPLAGGTFGPLPLTTGGRGPGDALFLAVGPPLALALP